MSAKRQIRCAIYTRKSTEEGLEQDFNSLDAQREACEAYVASQKAEGWVVLGRRYDDGGYSGGMLERPALRRLLNDIEDAAIDVVVVYKIDRLSRSLLDFTRLVEVFDRKSVTFVSVTQSFNTTTSMGRLTLNVLLSFAQFEREVTGERIRDKIAASKKKGIWMGGNPPLGYDVDTRKLVVNQAEAKTVRLIFRRYLELGCVRLLCADLMAQGVVSKHRAFGNGEKRGGKPMGRSAVYCILNNRAYIGETTHKGASYPGEHDAIVPRDLFDAVQQRLADQRPSLSSKARLQQDAPLAGLLFDETGTAMFPTYSIKQGGLRYRYYASRPTLKGERSKAAICRIPAPPFETFMARLLERLALSRGAHERDIQAVVQRIELQPNGIIVQFHRAAALALWRAANPDGAIGRDREVIASCRAGLANGESLSDDGERLILSLPVRARFRGGRAEIFHPAGATQPTARSDMALVKALARAHRWRQMLLDGEVASVEALARRVKLDRGHVGLTLNLAFLSPAITRAIIRGEQPPGLRLTHLLSADIPLCWREQEAAIVRAAGVTGR
jgi:DNA invertase Pin-like site-specific DNA recombinase